MARQSGRGREILIAYVSKSPRSLRALSRFPEKGNPLNLPVGVWPLINFNEALFKDGITRVISAPPSAD